MMSEKKLLDQLRDLIRTVQELLGHKNLNTTMIYTHILKQGGKGVKSPLDWYKEECLFILPNRSAYLAWLHRLIRLQNCQPFDPDPEKQQSCLSYSCPPAGPAFLPFPQPTPQMIIEAWRFEGDYFYDRLKN